MQSMTFYTEFVKLNIGNGGLYENNIQFLVKDSRANLRDTLTFFSSLDFWYSFEILWLAQSADDGWEKYCRNIIKISGIQNFSWINWVYTSLPELDFKFEFRIEFQKKYSIKKIFNASNWRSGGVRDIIPEPIYSIPKLITAKQRYIISIL